MNNTTKTDKNKDQDDHYFESFLCVINKLYHIHINAPKLRKLLFFGQQLRKLLKIKINNNSFDWAFRRQMTNKLKLERVGYKMKISVQEVRTRG